ncbi:MAG TPA: hypothetical protein VN695_09750 [Streptosporangiaceae bacterium]|nr:hypothetical protein [Streptosporangiaceae bacterium]
MTTLDAKLQLKPGQSIAVVGEGPALGLAAASVEPDEADAVLAFVVNRGELRSRFAVLAEMAGRGGLAWVAYPKARQLGTDLNRDVIGELAPSAGMEPVRQVSLDDTWSAMRLKVISHAPVNHL